MRQEQHLPHLPIWDDTVLREETPRDVIEEVAQLLGYDAADVLSVSITSGEVVVITVDRDDDGKRLTRRTRHWSVIR